MISNTDQHKKACKRRHTVAPSFTQTGGRPTTQTHQKTNPSAKLIAPSFPPTAARDQDNIDGSSMRTNTGSHFDSRHNSHHDETSTPPQKTRTDPRSTSWKENLANFKRGDKKRKKKAHHLAAPVASAPKNKVHQSETAMSPQCVSNDALHDYARPIINKEHTQHRTRTYADNTILAPTPTRHTRPGFGAGNHLSSRRRAQRARP